MKIVGKITDWQVMRSRPDKRVLIRYNAVTDEVEIMEQWLNTAALEEARREREMAELSPKSDFMKPLALIPNSERSRAIREGWNDDDAAWKRWMNDIDNRYLRLTKGYA